MRMRGHGGSSRSLRLLGNHSNELDQLALKLVDGIAHKETQIRRDLLVPAAAGVELEADFAGKLDETTLNKVMNVLSVAVLHELRIAHRGMLDVLQSIEQ